MPTNNTTADSFSYTKNVWSALTWSARTGNFAVSLYLADSPAQIIISASHGLKPFLQEIPNGNEISKNLQYTTQTFAFVLDPLTVCANYLVTQVFYNLIDSALNYVQKDGKLPLSPKEREQVISAGVDLAIWMLAKPTRSLLNSIKNFIANLIGGLQTKSQKAFNDGHKNLANTSLMKFINLHPLMPKAIAFSTFVLSRDKLVLYTFAGVAGFISEACKDYCRNPPPPPPLPDLNPTPEALQLPPSPTPPPPAHVIS